MPTICSSCGKTVKSTCTGSDAFSPNRFCPNLIKTKLSNLLKKIFGD